MSRTVNRRIKYWSTAMECVRARVRQKMSAKHLSQVTGEISKRKYGGCFFAVGFSRTKM